MRPMLRGMCPEKIGLKYGTVPPCYDLGIPIDMVKWMGYILSEDLPLVYQPQQLTYELSIYLPAIARKLHFG